MTSTSGSALPGKGYGLLKPVIVSPVVTSSDLKDFLRFPWKIYGNDPNWAPPILSMQARLLTPRKHPFWNTAERELFLARRGSDTVGRIVAIIDGRHNEVHRVKAGAFGFFECLFDPEGAVALFTRAENWLREKGMNFIHGPLNPSLNYEAGLLIQGFDSLPTLMMTYNPPYYLELLRGCGCRKEKDLLAYRVDRSYVPPSWAVEMMRRMTEKHQFGIQAFTSHREIKNRIQEFRRIYNECWADNWGFVPMSVEEADEMAREMLPIVDIDMCFFLSYNNEIVGVVLIAPDINPFLKRLNGKLGIAAIIKRLRFWSKDIKGLRGLVFGVKPEFRQMGLPFVAFHYILGLWKQKTHYDYLEMGWNLEDNHAINRLYEDGGIPPSKRYRIYSKALS
jgi:hypothetical protein